MTAAAIREVPSLDVAQASAVRRMVENAPGGHDNPPLSERALIHLRAPAPFRHFIAEQDGVQLGYAQLDPAADHVGAELAIAPVADASVATDLLAAVDKATVGERLLLWAHGSASAASEAAQQAEYLPIRSLLQMRRSLEDFDPAPTVSSDSSSGVVIRPFQPGVDDRAWLTVNARAFADHPEQGSWTQADLDDRIATDWFDPAGFLLAERGGHLLGYHWTKVHTDTEPPIGEVYVLGVDPAAQGLKLGKQLLAAGLRHLKERGLTTVLLYADASNTTAVQLYEKVGFIVFSTDTQYARP